MREPEQLRAMATTSASRIDPLLRDRARSTQELAEELGLPKGTVGHHLKVLENGRPDPRRPDAQGARLTEKFYGRTARLFLFETDGPRRTSGAIAAAALRQAASEVDAAARRRRPGFGLVRARLTTAGREALRAPRSKKLIDDFRAAEPAGGTPSYA